VSVASTDPLVPIALLAKRVGVENYLFAAATRAGTITATFTLPAGTVSTGSRIEVLGEERTIHLSGNTFSDRFAGYGVHLYRVVTKL
jgi:hypothetical protein